MASSALELGSKPLTVGELVRAFDWATTPLGPMGRWPPSLRIAYNLCEAATATSAVYWGPDLHLIYNDAWANAVPERHPYALGRPAREAWSEVWHIIAPDFQGVMESGHARILEEQMLPLQRDGGIEETYWNYSLTPIRDEEGIVRGIFLQAADVTDTVLVRKRLAFQVALSDRLRQLSDPVEIKMTAVEMLGRHIGVARAGFGQIDEGTGRVSVRRDWTRDESVPSLAGFDRLIDSFGANALTLLSSGETQWVDDYRDDRRVLPEHFSTWEEIGVQALVVVPLVKGGVLKAILYLHNSEPRRWQQWEVELAMDTADRIWSAVESVQAEQRLRDSEDHYRHAVELNPQVSWTALPDGQLNRVSRRWLEWTGTPGTGESWAEGLHPDDRERSFEAWGHSVATGEPYDIEHRVKMVDGSYRWARSRAFARRDSKGAICLWYGATEDIHERRQAEEHQRLLINELNHRVKNTLATVQAIAFQTLKGDIPLAEARSRFEARLLALSSAHNLLTEQNWEGAPLRRVVRRAVAPLAGEHERFDIEGEDIWVAPRAALALSLALHELSTNAAKYGALSNEHGRVSVRWCTRDDILRLEWKERGGPPVTEPKQRGFGSRLVERGLTADRGGTATMHFEPDGLCCVIEASLDAVTAAEEHHG